MPYLDDVLNPYQSLTGDLTPEDTLTGLLTEDGQLQGALAISDVVGVTELTELTDVSITNPINNDVLTYNDVTEKWENMPAQGGGGGGTSDYEDLDNKPSINSVTLSGNKTTADLNISYNDLDDKPTIPAAQVNSDWNAESGVAEILNKPTIPTELDDLSDVNINNPYQTDVLSYNESTSKWINHPVSLTVEGLSNVALSTPIAGKVLKISSVSGGVPTWRSSNVNYSEIHGTPTLAAVATSGSYDDLTDQPTIPDISTTNISSDYTFTKVSGSWEIHSASIYKTGNTYQAVFTLKGDGTAVSAGSDGCVYSMSTGTAPLMFSFFIAMVGTSFCLGFYNSGDSTWHFRPINAAVTLNANSRLNFSGLFIN
jgi:hypothetical protein